VGQKHLSKCGETPFHHISVVKPLFDSSILLDHIIRDMKALGRQVISPYCLQTTIKQPNNHQTTKRPNGVDGASNDQTTIKQPNDQTEWTGHHPSSMVCHVSSQSLNIC
jgi:hypothetical protein